LVEETGVPVENHRPAAITDILYHIETFKSNPYIQGHEQDNHSPVSLPMPERD